jgi:hypothetical protein
MYIFCLSINFSSIIQPLEPSRSRERRGAKVEVRHMAVPRRQSGRINGIGGMCHQSATEQNQLACCAKYACPMVPHEVGFTSLDGWFVRNSEFPATRPVRLRKHAKVEEHDVF